MSEQKPISKSYTALWLPHVSLHLLRPLVYLFTCSPMLQSWYIFTSSHISSTVIKTIMKLRNSSFAERSMAVSQKGRRTEEDQSAVLRNKPQRKYADVLDVFKEV